MNFEKLNSVASRIFFVMSFLLLAVALLEFITNLFGYTILRSGVAYTAGRLLEFAAVFMIFVLVLLIRQVREQLKKAKA